MKVKSESEVAQLCPTLRDPMDCSLPGSSVHAIAFSKAFHMNTQFNQMDLGAFTKIALGVQIMIE